MKRSDISTNKNKFWNTTYLSVRHYSKIIIFRKVIQMKFRSKKERVTVNYKLHLKSSAIKLLFNIALLTLKNSPLQPLCSKTRWKWTLLQVSLSLLLSPTTKSKKTWVLVTFDFIIKNFSQKLYLDWGRGHLTWLVKVQWSNVWKTTRISI